jgi:hypothetical protein
MKIKTITISLFVIALLGLIGYRVFSNAEEMDAAIQTLAQKLASSNPEAMQELKKIFWAGTEHWDQLLIERAGISGKLVLSENYPTTPVDFYMLTPNGRFDIEKKICLTISSYHSDQWSSIWSIQKILGAFLSVMISDFDTGISHIRMSGEQRNKLALESYSYNVNVLPHIFKHFKRFVIVSSDNTYTNVSDL